jgi:hypothetical protein
MSAAQRDLAARLAALGEGETLTVMLRCPTPRCRTHARLEVARVAELPAGQGNKPDVDRFPETAGMASWVGSAFWLREFAGACVACSRTLLAAGLKIVHAPDVACSSSCWHAVSAECKCSCRGANHGIL